MKKKNEGNEDLNLKILELEKENARLISKIKNLESTDLKVFEKDIVKNPSKYVEERYRTLFETSPYGLIILDPDTATPIEFNDQLCRQLGYSRSEFAELKLWDIEAKESENESKNHIQKILLEGRDDFETIHRTKNGELRNIFVTAQSVKIAGHSLYHCIWQDITEQKKAQEEIQRTNENLKIALQASKAGMWDWDIEGNVFHWSDEFLKIFGMDSTVKPGFESWTKSVHPDDLEMAANRIQASIDNRTELINEYRIVLPEGGIRWIRSVGKTYYNQEKPIRMIGLCMDVTETKLAESAIAKSEIYLKKAQSMGKIGHFSFDPETNKVEGSEELFRIFDINTDQPLFKSFAEAVYPEDAHLIFPFIDRAVKDGIPYDVEHRIRHKNGTVLFVRAKGEVVCDQYGKRMIGTVQDITDRKKIEAEIVKSEEKYRNLFNTAQVGMVRIRLDGSEILDVNDKLLEVFGYTREEVIKNPSLIYWEDPIEWEKANKLLKSQGFLDDFECRIRNKQGKIGICLISLKIFSEDDFFEGTLIDITERKRFEEKIIESENLYKSLYENSTIGIYRTTLEGKIILANPTLVKMLGFSSFDELMSRNLGRDQYEPEYDRSQFLEKIETESEIKGLEACWKTRTGKELFVRESVVAIRDSNGNILYFDGIVENITERKKVEAELRNTKILLEEAFRQSPIPMVLVSMPDAILRIVNPSMLEFLGMTDEPSVIGRSLLDLKVTYKDYDSHGELGSINELPLARALRGIRTSNEERMIVRKDGTIRWGLVSGVPVYNEKKELMAGCLIITDISERKKVEQDLSESEKRYKSLVNNINVGIFNSTLEGKFLFVNSTVLEMSGYSDLNDFKNISAKVLYYDVSDRDYLINELNENGFIKNFELRSVKKDNSVYWTAINAVLLKDALGKSQSILGSIIDITERKRAIETIKRNEQRLNQVTENAGDWIWETDINGLYTYSSPAVENILGYSIDELVGKKYFYDFFIPEQKEQLKTAALDVYAQKGSFSNFVNQNINKKGETVVLETSGSPILDEKGNLAGYVGIDTNITDRIKAENEHLRLQNLESLGLLAGGIAHDFNNILTSVLGYVSLLMDENLENNVKTSLNSIERATKRAVGLTNQLLTFAKGGAPTRKVIDLKKLIQDTTTFSLSGSNIKPEFDFKGELRIDADHGQISQVIQNLVINAKDALPSGGTIKISMDDYSDNKKEYIKILVSDNGYGIPQEVIHKIFDPYFTTKEKGNGLGLSVCHSIIKRHDGNIYVDSSIGVGTTFTILLPASRENVSAEKEVRKIINNKLNILIMDDEPEVRELLTNMLERQGHTVTGTENGQECINVFKESKESGESFDVIFLDLTVRGGMGGKEAVPILKEIDPKIKVIVSSGYAESSISDFIESGFDGALKKPYTKNDLNEALFNILSH